MLVYTACVLVNIVTTYPVIVEVAWVWWKLQSSVIEPGKKGLREVIEGWDDAQDLVLAIIYSAIM